MDVVFIEIVCVWNLIRRIAADRICPIHRMLCHRADDVCRNRKADCL